MGYCDHRLHLHEERIGENQWQRADEPDLKGHPQTSTERVNVELMAGQRKNSARQKREWTGPRDGF